MKHRESQTTTTTSSVVVKKTCDICGEESPDPNSETQWSYSPMAETSVQMTTSYGTCEGGSGTHIEFDICPKCFSEKLVPMLEALGAVPCRYEFDF